jgi:hypothetical protein
MTTFHRLTHLAMIAVLLRIAWQTGGELWITGATALLRLRRSAHITISAWPVGISRGRGDDNRAIIAT